VVSVVFSFAPGRK